MKTGQLIKELRQKKGITQEVLAEKTEISVRTIQRIENGEVDPRAYTLQSIATALGVEYEVLANSELDINEPETSKWIPLIHLSGFLILIIPPIIIWIKKRKVQGIRQHAIDVINFQLSISIYAIPLVLFRIYPILIMLFLFSQAVIIINAVKVTSDKAYKYPLNIKILK